MTLEDRVLDCINRGVNTYGGSVCGGKVTGIAAALGATDEPRTRRIDRALQRLRRKGAIRWDTSSRVWHSNNALDR